MALALPSAGHDPCRFDLLPTVESVRDVTVPYLRFPPRTTRVETRKLKDYFPEEGVFLVAADYNHYYLIVDGVRYDPQALRPGRFQAPPDGHPVPTSVFVHFPNVSREAKERLKERMQREPAEMSVTCVHGACRLLESAGIRLGGPDGGPPLEQANTLVRIFRYGFVDDGGRPVESRTYLNSDRPLEELLGDFQRSDEIYYRAFRLNARRLGGAGGVLSAIRREAPPDLAVEAIVIDVLNSRTPEPP